MRIEEVETMYQVGTLTVRRSMVKYHPDGIAQPETIIAVDGKEYEYYVAYLWDTKNGTTKWGYYAVLAGDDMYKSKRISFNINDNYRSYQWDYFKKQLNKNAIKWISKVLKVKTVKVA
jgi:hypothetical protein